ncbi:MAG: SAF domain-containing protein [Acidimicrobiales bacterium]
MATSTLRRPRPASSGGADRTLKAASGSAAAGRRSAPLALAGVACMLLGGLAAVAIYLRATDSVTALVVKQAMAPGQVIAEGDLGVVELSARGLAHVPAADRSQVVGRPAAVALPRGTLLTPAAIGEPSALGPGLAVVGLALKVGQMPAGLRAGDRVALVDTDTAGPAPSSARTQVTYTEDATVLSVTSGDRGSAAAISVRVPRSMAAAIAAAGAGGHVSVVLLPAAP